MYSDLQSIAPEQYMKQITKRLTELKAVSVRFLHECNKMYFSVKLLIYEWLKDEVYYF